MTNAELQIAIDAIRNATADGSVTNVMEADIMDALKEKQITANSYSTNETLTGGTFTDENGVSKPIYKKSFIGSMPIPANITTSVIDEDLTSLNIENVFLEHISIIDVDSETVYFDKITFMENASANFFKAGTFISYNNLRFYAETSTALTTDLKVILIIKYTKTTD